MTDGMALESEHFRGRVLIPLCAVAALAFFR
jgi:hypothetical protein